jgi:hypothetical protein
MIMRMLAHLMTSDGYQYAAFRQGACELPPTCSAIPASRREQSLGLMVSGQQIQGTAPDLLARLWY